VVISIGSQNTENTGTAAQYAHSGGNSARRHDLDALRAIAMLLGICLHAIAAYSGSLWVVMDSHQNEAFEKAVYFIHGFRMQLFFLVSGFFTALLTSRYGSFGMLGNRASRILLPFLICVLTLIPSIKVLEFFALSATVSHPQEPIFRAIQQGNVEVVLDLLEKGQPSVLEEKQKRLGLTPLTWAVLCESEQMVRLLLDRGANPMATNRGGENSLTFAAMLGRVDLLELLVKKGGDALQPTETGKLPWIAAHQSPEESSTMIWLARGKRPDDMTAFKQGRQAVIEYLDQVYQSRGAIPSSSQISALHEAAPAMAKLPTFMQRYFSWLASDNMVIKIGGFELNLLQENSVDHLWFLWFLWWLCLIHAGLGWIRRIPGLRAFVISIGLYPGLLVAVGLTACLQAFMNLDYYPRTLNFVVGPDYSSGFMPKPHVILYYAVFFFFGSWYFQIGDHECRLGKHWWVALPLAVLVVFPLLFVVQGDRLQNCLLQTLYTWLMVVGAIGLAHRIFRTERKWFRYLADSSYWLYLIHVPLVICCQWFLYFWPLPALIKTALVLIITISILLASYELFVRHTIIGRILNGKKPSRIPNKG